jgi:hypothetical protein
MTLRYALASPTLRRFDEAWARSRHPGRTRRAFRRASQSTGSPQVRKTRLTGGCHHLVADACPYANVCETRQPFPATSSHPPCAQLDDIRTEGRHRASRLDQRHATSVLNALDSHLQRLDVSRPAKPALTPAPWPVNRVDDFHRPWRRVKTWHDGDMKKRWIDRDD